MTTTSRAAGLPALLVGAALLIPAYGASPVAAGSAPHAGQAALAVTGFQEEGDPNSRITASAKALSTVGIDGVNLSANGKSVGTPDAGARKALAVTHRDGLRGEFLVGNFGRGDFAEKHAHNLLSSSANIAAVVKQLTHSTTTQGWDGISVDLESLTGRDRAGLLTFLAALHAALPAGDTLSICISNSVTSAEYRHRGYDLKGIAANVDRIILMAYDEHGSWENHPGAVGELAWQKRGLATMESVVPADQIDLGQAGYGYAWRPHRNYQISDAQARQLVRKDHGRSHYDKTVGEWTARLPDGSTLWWAAARSYQRRVTLARHDHLHGLAVWSLGLSDPLK